LDLSATLIQFVFRLSSGLALAMLCTSPAQVTPGFFQKHLWVVLGLQVLAALVSWSGPSSLILGGLVPGLAIAAAVLSYLGSLVWFAERDRLGQLFLALVAGVSLAGAWVQQPWPASTGLAIALRALDAPTGVWLLGTGLAAMLLGHWYLNTPTMQMAPLQRLVLLFAGAIGLRVVVCGLGLATLSWTAPPEWNVLALSQLALRWLAGLAGAALVAKLTWETLKIPNTQSATGILYVGVIVTFLGELLSQLLSAQWHFPV